MTGRTIHGSNILNGDYIYYRYPTVYPFGLGPIYGPTTDERDTIFGHGGNDFMEGGGGADHLDGGTDFVFGGYYFPGDTAGYAHSPAAVTVDLRTGTGRGGHAEGDTLVDIENLRGSAYGDRLMGDDFANTLSGNGGNDHLFGYGATDELFGDLGDDWLDGGAGPDTLNGGTDIDTASYRSSTVGVVANLGDGVGYFGDAEGDTLIDVENLSGSRHDDILLGDRHANRLDGLDGPDRLKGFGGSDTLDGGWGADTLVGGFGHDTYIVDNRDDTITELAGQGTDEVRTWVSYTLAAGADVETLRTTNDDGTASVDITGNAIANQQIIGNNGDNTLDGGGGVDALTGRRGNDTYIVDSNSDTITERGGEGRDSVLARASYTLTDDADVETLATNDDEGTAVIDLTGNARNQDVRGNDGINVINGGGGSDSLIGLGGNDFFRFDTPLSAANVDFITDLNREGNDTIVLENAIFGALPAGPLAAERFVTHPPLEADDNVIYNAATGALSYDSDGNGSAAAVQFALVMPGTVVTHDDFLVV